MDELNLQPDTLNTADTPHEIEGYEDHVEEIEQAYPEEDWRTPAEQEAEREAFEEDPLKRLIKPSDLHAAVSGSRGSQ